MNDVRINCDRKSNCIEPCEAWLIAHNRCPVCKNKLIHIGGSTECSHVIGRSVVNMRIEMDPIEMIAWFDIPGMPRPIRFRHQGNVVKVEMIIRISEESLQGIA